ncbi:hypothetical protein COB11_08175 [Candidatus Aerophobetes bacterium]|uniref:Uncharacterized protein n=1 Tax=Aerophobetes bacterium TaxID=2030807 RepID=A0A2A4YBT6_UNCAE|nr:MAG: hypothetical protein COB11_08175 [Candidatus Aerophobetes bacterium]
MSTSASANARNKLVNSIRRTFFSFKTPDNPKIILHVWDEATRVEAIFRYSVSCRKDNFTDVTWANNVADETDGRSYHCANCLTELTQYVKGFTYEQKPSRAFVLRAVSDARSAPVADDFFGFNI